MGKKRDETGLKFPKLKKVKERKLTVAKVQTAVNKAVRERDQFCRVQDGRHPCNGVLTASHFHSVGGHSPFRFYPLNIHAQCFGHHGIHERKQDPFFYREFMLQNHGKSLDFMERNFFKSIKYTQPVLRDIMNYAKAGDLDGLTAYIEKLILEA